MKHIAYFPAILLAISTLCGCAAPQWQKPGATPAQAQTDQTQCTAAATRQFPPHIETIEMSGGSFNPGASQCGNPNNTDDTQCYHTPNQLQQPTFRHRDTNEKPRKEAIQACMIKKGWQLD